MSVALIERVLAQSLCSWFRFGTSIDKRKQKICIYVLWSFAILHVWAFESFCAVVCFVCVGAPVAQFCALVYLCVFDPLCGRIRC